MRDGVMVQSAVGSKGNAAAAVATTAWTVSSGSDWWS